MCIDPSQHAEVICFAMVRNRMCIDPWQHAEVNCVAWAGGGCVLT